MPISSTVASSIAKRLPKVVSPGKHGILDYALAAAFFGAGAAFWKRNRRAALASFINGGTITAVALLTEYPGGVSGKISYRTHGRIEAGLPALTAGLPRFMGFSGDKEARFFALMAMVKAAVTGITEFEENKARTLAA